MKQIGKAGVRNGTGDRQVLAQYIRESCTETRRVTRRDCNSWDGGRRGCFHEGDGDGCVGLGVERTRGEKEWERGI